MLPWKLVCRYLFELFWFPFGYITTIVKSYSTFWETVKMFSTVATPFSLLWAMHQIPISPQPPGYLLFPVSLIISHPNRCGVVTRYGFELISLMSEFWVKAGKGHPLETGIHGEWAWGERWCPQAAIWQTIRKVTPVQGKKINLVRHFKIKVQDTNLCLWRKQQRQCGYLMRKKRVTVLVDPHSKKWEMVIESCDH